MFSLSSIEGISWIRFSDTHEDNPSIGDTCVDTIIDGAPVFPCMSKLKCVSPLP